MGVLRHLGAFICFSHSWVEPSSQVLANCYLSTHAHSLGPCQLLAVLLASCLSWVQDVPELLSHPSFQELTYFLFLHLGLFPLENAVWWITIAVILEMNIVGWKASFTAHWLCLPWVRPVVLLCFRFHIIRGCFPSLPHMHLECHEWYKAPHQCLKQSFNKWLVKSILSESVSELQTVSTLPRTWRHIFNMEEPPQALQPRNQKTLLGSLHLISLLLLV